jgi:hypothetical protein
MKIEKIGKKGLAVIYDLLKEEDTKRILAEDSDRNLFVYTTRIENSGHNSTQYPQRMHLSRSITACPFFPKSLLAFEISIERAP